MKKAEFLLEVKAELDNIKKKATKEEIGKLNFGLLYINSVSRCIYGQMTGNCRSDRAIEITTKKYSNIGNGNSFSYQSYAIGKKGQERFTPLEKYLYMVGKPMHKNLIAYLKGDIQEIILK